MKFGTGLGPGPRAYGPGTQGTIEYAPTHWEDTSFRGRTLYTEEDTLYRPSLIVSLWVIKPILFICAKSAPSPLRKHHFCWAQRGPRNQGPKWTLGTQGPPH